MALRRSAVAIPNSNKTVGDYLTEFQQQLGNQFCADCLAKNPQWIAFPHGVLICDNCAGAHRSLGSHVSQVKSIVYDKWTMKMFHNLEKCGGNTVINSKLAKYCERYQQPIPQSSADEREKFIKNKYELKLYTKPQKTNEKEETAKRLAHYFIIVCKEDMMLPDITKKDDKNTKNGKKKSRNIVVPESIFDVEFTKCVSYRYPEVDYESVPLPARVFDFIFPASLRVSEEMSVPEQRSFVLTDAEGNKNYGVAIIFWERLSPMDILSMSETLNAFRSECDCNEITTMPGAVYAPKALCILSHWPFYNQFSTFLQTIYRVTKTPSAPIPGMLCLSVYTRIYIFVYNYNKVERYLMNFMHEVPVPPMGKTSVQFVVGDVSITLRRAPANQLPFLNVDSLNLFKCLSVGNILTLFNALLQEQKTVLISSHLHLLLEVAETITSLLFPFQLQGVYMPLLPSKLLDFLHSPVPFLAGVDPSWIKGQHYDDVVFVYLDDDTILTTSQTQLEPLPKRPKAKLETRLDELLPWLNVKNSSPNKPNRKKSSMASGHEEKINYDRITQHINHKLDMLPISHFLTSGSTISNDNSNKSKANKQQSSNQIFREIQKAFLKFFTSIMENYGLKYTEKQKKSDPNIRNKDWVFFKWNKQAKIMEFERDRFLEEGVDKTFRPFMEKMTVTQLFMAFCQEREELIESKSKDIPREIRYFDEEIIAKKNRSTLRTKKMPTTFLDDRSLDLKSVFVANPPNLNDLDANEFNYSSFPNKLKQSRYGVVRNVKAPWDTQKNYSRKSALMRRSRSMRHVAHQSTVSAYQQLMAMQHTAHINKAKSWDNFTEQTLIVQQYIRMIINRKAFIHWRSAILKLQKSVKLFNQTKAEFVHFNEMRRSAVILQSVFKTYLCVQKRKNKIYYQSTTTLQAVFRGYLYQKQFEQLYTSSITIQAVIRTYTKQQRVKRTLSAISLCQSYINCGNARVKHLNTMSAVSRCQAVLRGTLIRTQQTKVLNMQLSKIRRQILELWAKTFTAYMYRAKFWIVYEQPTYLNLAIHNEELVRLNNLLHRLSTSKKALNEAKHRFDAERTELRRLLKEELQQNIRDSLYTSWGINIKSKSKKDKLLDELFKTGNSANPKESATALLTICSSHASSVLDVTQQVELRKADRIRDNLLLTVFSSLSSMQSLNRSLQKQRKVNKKQRQVMKTINDELAHKQSIIDAQRRISTRQLSLSPNSFKNPSNHTLYSPLRSKGLISANNLNNDNDFKLTPSKSKRRYSDIGIDHSPKVSNIAVRKFQSEDIVDPTLLRKDDSYDNDEAITPLGLL